MNHAAPIDLPTPAQRWEGELIDLNTRIAALSRLLQVPLDQEASLNALLARSHPAYIAHPDDPGHPSSMRARQHQELDELRGLLVLRCEVMTQALHELGLPGTHEVTQSVHAHMGRLGLGDADHGFLIGDRIDAMFATDPQA